MIWWNRFRRSALLVGLFALAAIAIFLVHGVSPKPSVSGAVFNAKTNIVFPRSAAIIDVTKPPYNAKGDGKTDDTEAIQRALLDHMGHHKILYLPNGTYLVSRTINWSNKDSKQSNAWGFNFIQGQNATKTIIRLKDRTFTDTNSPQTIMWCGGFGSADWFHNYIQNVTFNVGRDNPGAIGLQFYSNNTGAIRDIAVVSEDGKGAIGLDLGHRDMNGPLLVHNVQVKGFEVGIRTGGVVNSQTFEQISLSDQSKVGLANWGQSISVRGLTSINAVPALEAQSLAVLLDSKLIGKGSAKTVAAIKLGDAPFFARNVTTEGYQRAIATTKGQGVPGTNITEFMQGNVTSPFKAPATSLNLPVRETPDVPWDDPKQWAVVDAFGADPTGNQDSAEAIQKAIDSGATTVFFPGFYNLKQPVKIRGNVRRILGTGAWIDYNGNSPIDFIVEDGKAPVVVIEHFEPISGAIEVNTSRTVVFRSIGAGKIIFKRKGDVFLEDFVSNDLRFNPGQRVWARQLNVENEGTHVTNNGADLWVLGYKTERGGTLLHTKDKGKSEIFGNFSYTTTAGKLGPMFRTENASVFAFFNEVCYTGDPFAVLIQETRGTITKIIKRGEGWIAPYIARPM